MIHPERLARHHREHVEIRAARTGVHDGVAVAFVEVDHDVEAVYEKVLLQRAHSLVGSYHGFHGSSPDESLCRRTMSVGCLDDAGGVRRTRVDRATRHGPW